MLGQCCLLAELELQYNHIGDEGAESLAGVLGQCSSLATLNLAGNDIGAAGAGRLAWVLGQCSSRNFRGTRSSRKNKETEKSRRQPLEAATKT